MNSKYKQLFKGKRILVTGGTGSIGSEVLRHLTNMDVAQIKVFSRDEYKQHKLKYKYADLRNIKYILGDIRDFDSIDDAAKDVDIIFHCAALKHVPISEEMPLEFVKTNILGSENIKRAAIKNKVPLTVSVSTDKAVNSLNVMGLTKAIQEKIFISNSLHEENQDSKFVIVRFGNVIGTHGSLFPILLHQITGGNPLTITVPEMTRFYMTTDDAVELIFWSALNGKGGEIVVKKMRSLKVIDLVKSFLKVMHKDASYPIKEIGIRVGEKMHEELITADEILRVKENQGYYVIPSYSTRNIEENLASPAKNNLNQKIFQSDYSDNFCSQDEINKYIQDFLDQRKSLIDII